MALLSEAVGARSARRRDMHTCLFVIYWPHLATCTVHGTASAALSAVFRHRSIAVGAAGRSEVEAAA